MLFAQLSCSTADRNQAANESEEAYNDFKDYVSNVETATDNQADSAEANWEETTASSQATYEQKASRVDKYTDTYDNNRKQEIDALKTRYNTYWENRNRQHQNQVATSNISGTSRNGGVAAEFRTETIAATSPAGIRTAYENFVNHVKANKENFTSADWKAAENYFDALDSHKNAVESQLSDKDKYEIGKAKSKYTALKAGRAGIDVSEAASQTKETGKEVGSKVGNAAEKLGSEVKSTTKKVARKIDNKIDDDPTKD
jgi:hypothetical protein